MSNSLQSLWSQVVYFFFKEDGYHEVQKYS